MSRPDWTSSACPEGMLWTRRVGSLCLVVEQDQNGCFWDVVLGEDSHGWGLADREEPSLEAAQVAAEHAARAIADGIIAALGVVL